MAHIANEEQMNVFIFSTIFKGRVICGNNPISNTPGRGVNAKKRKIM